MAFTECLNLKIDPYALLCTAFVISKALKGIASKQYSEAPWDPWKSYTLEE